MANLCKADLEKPVALKEAVVDVFGGQATIRQMDALSNTDFQILASEKTDGGKVPHAFPHFAFHYISKSMIDPSTGGLFFDSAEEAIKLLGKQPQAEVDKLFKACQSLNRDSEINEENIEEAAKNSEAVASSASS